MNESVHDRAEAPTFAVGDVVEKYTGDYQLPGEVRAVFKTRAGKVRYVVEHYPGLLHIYSGSNLRPFPSLELPELGPGIASVHFAPDASVEERTEAIEWRDGTNEEQELKRQLADAPAEIMRLNDQIAEWSKANLDIVAKCVAETKRAAVAERRLARAQEALRWYVRCDIAAKAVADGSSCGIEYDDGARARAALQDIASIKGEE